MGEVVRREACQGIDADETARSGRRREEGQACEYRVRTTICKYTVYYCASYVSMVQYNG